MSIILPCLYSFLACIGFCIIFNIRGKMIFYASIGGVLAWLTFELAAVYQNDLIQYFAATVVLSLYSEIMARVHKVPVTIFLIAALIPLVPGSGIYYTMEHFIQGNTQEFLSTFIHTFAIAGSLAFGILLVSSLVYLWKKIENNHKLKLNKK